MHAANSNAGVRSLERGGDMAALTIDGRRVSYFEHGSGEPIVLLHAGGTSGKQWAKTARLLDSRFRVIAPDLWGFGDTERWSGGRN